MEPSGYRSGCAGRGRNGKRCKLLNFRHKRLALYARLKPNSSKSIHEGEPTIRPKF
jgi:hypothetical protein